MNRKTLVTVLLVVSVALVLATAYLAIVFAPIPQTSVKSAGEVMPSIVGSKITVAGFVAYRYGNPDSSHEAFSIADFRDYSRFRAALEADNLASEWWTVRPIDVVSSFGAPFSTEIQAGVNISLQAEVQHSGIGPNSNITGYSLAAGSSDDLELGGFASSYPVLTAPVAQKIFYFHMPSAWVAYLAFGTTLLGSAFYLKTRKQRWDHLAFSSAEIGVVFATIAILTGPIWAKQEWGVYWRWDDTRLVTTFIMWLVYIGYLMLRAALVEPQSKARVSAVYGVLSFVAVPMSILSSRVAPLLQSSHPQVIATSSGGLSPEAGMTVGVAVIAFTMLFITTLIKRMEIAESEEELEDIKRRIGEEE